MVKYLFALLLLIPQTFLLSEEVMITAEVDSGGYIGEILRGTITITHNEGEKIDEKSFRLDQKPLEVKFLKKVRISPDAKLIISIYNFTFEAKDKGLLLLPPVQVKVGEQIYRSIPTSYEVKEAKEIEETKEGAKEIIFRLENIIIGDTGLYPGQRIEVGYRYIFNYSVDLTEENLPLLEAAHFRKVGGKESNEYVKDGLNVVEITQKIEAVDPGVFTFGPSKVSGIAYIQDRFGKKQYAKKESAFETNPVTLQVWPLPGSGRPISFNGAIGEDFTFITALIGTQNVRVGDKITLLITIQGRGDIENLPMPEVCCQPGMSGFFLVSDLPPEEEIVKNTKKFKVDLRPLSATINEIPELEFSYFNPKEKDYITLKSAPINLEVYEQKEKVDTALKKGRQTDQTVDSEKVFAPKALEIEGSFYLVAEDLQNITFGTYWVFLIIPFGALALLLQIQFRNYLLEKKREEKSENSKDLFLRALKEPPESPDFFRYLRRSFLYRLVEIGEIESVEIPTDSLKESGLSGKVRTFLQEMEELRFSEKERSIDISFIEKAKKLFNTELS